MASVQLSHSCRHPLSPLQNPIDISMCMCVHCTQQTLCHHFGNKQILERKLTEDNCVNNRYICKQYGIVLFIVLCQSNETTENRDRKRTEPNQRIENFEVKNSALFRGAAADTFIG